MSAITAREYFTKLKLGNLLFKNILNAVKSGENNIGVFAAREEMKQDGAWIDHINELLYSVENIVKDPQRSIKSEDEIVLIEKAKRITADSVRHLASHSNYIRAVDDDGTVHPAKIKTQYLDEDLHIYENRFVYTLIVRLLSFIEQKYNYYIENPHKYDTVNLKYKSELKYDDVIIDYDLNIKAKKPLRQEEGASAQEKLKMIKKRLLLLTGTDFFQSLSKTKPLNPPISKTNMIKMNVDYNNCYKLWLFLYSFVNTGYGVKVSEIELPHNQDYTDDLAYVVAISLKTMINNNMFVLDENQYNMQPEKQFNVEKKFNYIPVFKDFALKEYNQTDYLNDYYYQKIKEILGQNDEQNDIRTGQDFIFNFTDFYSQLTEINNKLFEEMINYDSAYLSDGKAATKEEKLNNEINQLKQIYARRHLLSNLKKIDYEQSCKKESLLLAKIKKLEYEMDKLKGDEEQITPISIYKKDMTRRQIIDSINEKDKELGKKIIEEQSKTD